MISREKKKELSKILFENVDKLLPTVHYCINYEKSPKRIGRVIIGLENWLLNKQNSWVQNRSEGIERLIIKLKISREYRIAKIREKFIDLSVILLIVILLSGCFLYVIGVFY